MEILIIFILIVALALLSKFLFNVSLENRDLEDAKSKLKGNAATLRNENSKLKTQKEALEKSIKELTKTLDSSNVQSQKDLNKLSKKYITERKREILKNITPNNYATSHKNIVTLFDFCLSCKSEIDNDLLPTTEKELKDKFEEAVRKEMAKKEQSRIKEQIREEQRAEKEFQKELERIEREEKLIEKAIQDALEKHDGENSAEIEALRKQLEEAKEKYQRTKAQAELTRSGHVYVISNAGALGTDVFKVGMTRRLEPMDRVKELGDASVPFPFDVHMMITSDDAPTLENELHNALHSARLNKVNLRKEFFKTDIDRIAELVKKHHGHIDYVAEQEALEYNDSVNMTPEDYEFTSRKTVNIDDFRKSQALTSTTKNEEPKTKAKIIQLRSNPNKPEQSKAKCGECGKVLNYPKKMTGKNVECPDCNQQFALP